MIIEILTLFPGMIEGALNDSIIMRARAGDLLDIRVRNIRDYTTDKHHVTDDAPFGGGPGMVMKPEPIAAAIEAALADHPAFPLVTIYLSPEGETWNQKLAEEYARLPGLLLLCGHYEGIDERIRQRHIDREISIGDYVLTGGELPAMVVLDSIARHVPGVLGNEESVLRESFGREGLFDHPHYTRPADWRGLKVPDILLSGHHAKIDEWRRHQSLARTLARRPGLIEKIKDRLSPADLAYLREIANLSQTQLIHRSSFTVMFSRISYTL
ncbi:MAG: tRNA (guanosine(37)-N1)-methyltransferase TrmD [bacterium]|nr:tRNA (guanosine(37)-N1)-methyltransferase TrmD [Candidatus Sumerlaeota bacterium]